jgi:hypothetical protein
MPEYLHDANVKPEKLIIVLLFAALSFSARADWLVQTYRDGSSVTAFADADRLIANTTPIATGTIPYTDLLGYSTGEGTGHFSLNYPVPGLPQNQPTDDYAVEVTGTLNVPTTGYYTFGLNTDDGARLVVDGTPIITDDAIHAPRDSGYVSITLAAGLHSVNWIWFNHGGGATAEVFWAGGIYSGFDSSFVLLGNSTTTTQSISQNGALVAYWPFSGNANDASGNGNNGAVNGAILTTNRFGTPNSAYSFGGSGYIQIADSASLESQNAVSVSLWFNQQSLPSGQYACLLYKANSAQTLGFADRSYSLWVTPGGGEIHFTSTATGAGSQTAIYTSSGLFGLNQWVHVVGIVDASNQQMSVYVNGNLVGTAAYPSKSILTGNYPLRIGSFVNLSGGDQAGFHGLIDDVRIYNRALSASEIQQLYSGENSLGHTAASASQPTQISLNSPSPASSVDSLVLVTHGVEPFGFGDISWITNMANAIRAKAPSNWEVRTLDWTAVSKATEPDIVSLAGTVGGHLYGSQLGQQQSWKHIHLIAHSAGSSVIEAIASELKALPNPPVIHETFLDPYLGSLHQLQPYFGSHSDWSDNYFAANGLSLWTNAKLFHARNVDVSWLDSAHITYVTNYWSPSGMAGTTPSTIYEQQIPVGVQAYVSSSHGWPYGFYQATITGGLANTSGYGFPLSEENGWNSFASYPENNDPVVLNGQLANYQRLTPAQTGVQIPFSLLPNATSSSGVNFTGNSGATLFNTFSFSSFVANGNGVRPMGGSTAIAPAWLSLEMTITNSANFVQFDAAFTDSNSAQGLLTVYWDTNQIGMVDERAASTNWQTYSFPLSATVTNDVHILGFRLDSFNNTLSSIAVTNVTTGFTGVIQPVTFGMALFTNSTPILQLTGASNYNYLVESSTNLVDWRPTALLVNSNGTVFFADKAATNSPAKFYRAMMP